MFARMMMIAMAAALALVLGGCSTTQSPVGSVPEPLPAESPAAGSRLAPGLHELEDGSVQVVG
ncbi:MAG: hypothetical protein Q7U89_00175, partial [Coriobacteriia bacterium]|nr:hypothetical protein [Coriobacteriia bacterium]